MKHNVIFDQYVTAIKGLADIERKSETLARIEGYHASIAGVTNINIMYSTVAAVFEYNKSLKEMIDHPFEDAVVDNTTSCVTSLQDSMRIFQDTPEHEMFDIRDIIVPDKLRECLDMLLRSRIATDDAWAEELFTCITDLLKLVASALKGSPFEDSLVSLRVLDKQKYFTYEERRAKEEAEERRHALEAAANERAEMQSQLTTVIKLLDDRFDAGMLETSLDPKDLLEGCNWIKDNLPGVGKLTLESLYGLDIVLSKDTTVRTIKYALDVLALYGIEVAFNSADLGMSIGSGEVDSSITIPAGSCLTIV